MNIALKIGVKSQARKLIGSAPGWAGSSGGCGVGVGARPDPDAPGAARRGAGGHDEDDQDQERDVGRSGPTGSRRSVTGVAPR